MNTLEGKVALVTGASSGIGRATALLLAQQGARVVITARREQALGQVVEDITKAGGHALALAGDVNDEPHAQALVQLAQDAFGALHIAINNAGTLGASCSVPEMTQEDWHHAVDTNLTSAFLGAKYQLPALVASGGSLVFVSSIVGNTVGLPQMPAYAAAKAGLVGLAKSLAAEYGPQGVRVNALLPGGTDTPMGAQAAPTPDAQAFVASMHALKRIATPEEIASAAVFLASDAASFVTGSALLVDGGVSINHT